MEAFNWLIDFAKSLLDFWTYLNTPFDVPFLNNVTPLGLLGVSTLVVILTMKLIKLIPGA